jgi:putative ABC transport system permease protein
MPIREVLRVALEALWANKLRTVLTLLGVIVGVATVIVVVSLIEGFNAYIDDKIADIGTNAFRVQKYGIDDFSSLDKFLEANRRNPDIRLREAEAIREAAPLVDQLSIRAISVGEVKRGNESMSNVVIQGASANALEIDRLSVGSGRFYTATEESHRREVAFIGSDVATRLFKQSDPIGQQLKVDGRPYTIVGVAEPIGSVFGQTRDSFVFIPISRFLDSYGSRRSLYLLVTSIDEESYSLAIDQVRVALRVRRGLQPNEPDNFGIITPDAINQLRDKIFGTIQTTTIGVTSIALVVGGIVIMNIMLVSVVERTKEIGLRKSLGARRADLLKQFLAESTVMATLGGIIGTLVALAAAKAVATFTPIPTALPIAWTVASISVSALVGLVSGVYPAWRAAGLDPIVALRSE